MKHIISELCLFAPKSSIKAGEANETGDYMFFTSSSDENKRYYDYLYDGEGIIMGTGGNATLHYYNGKYATSTDCLVLLPNTKIVDCKYLYYFFLSNKHVLEAGFKGAGLKHTNKKYIGNIVINNIPEIEQQKYVVNVLDKINGLVELYQKENNNLDQIVKSRFVEMFGDTRINKCNFKKKNLRDSCVIVTGNTPSRAVPEYYGDYIEWIKTDNIVKDQLYPTQAVECLSKDGMNVGRTADKNAILMSCIAGSISSIGRVCITDRKVAFNQQINAIVPLDYDAFFLYVMLQLSKDYLVEEINMALKGILSKTKLGDKEFFIPPMELQKQFSDFVKKVEQQKATVQKSIEKLEALKKSLMQEYFG